MNSLGYELCCCAVMVMTGRTVLQETTRRARQTELAHQQELAASRAAAERERWRVDEAASAAEVAQAKAELLAKLQPKGASAAVKDVLMTPLILHALEPKQKVIIKG